MNATPTMTMGVAKNPAISEVQKLRPMNSSSVGRPVHDKMQFHRFKSDLTGSSAVEMKNTMHIGEIVPRLAKLNVPAAPNTMMKIQARQHVQAQPQQNLVES